MADTQDLNPDFNNKVNQLIAQVRVKGGNPTITSGYRSFDEQQRLYNSGNNGVPVARPGTSLHEKGLAADISGDTNTMNLLHSLAGQFGISFPFGNDPVHAQLAGAAGRRWNCYRHERVGSRCHDTIGSVAAG